MAISQTVKQSLVVLTGCLLLAALHPSSATGQTAPPANPPLATPSVPANLPPATPGVPADPANPAVPPPIQEDKRILGVLPNYRTAEMPVVYTPIPPSYKMKIALKDSFDYPLMGVSAIYASFYQLFDSHPQFGQGVEGYAKRLGTSYTDQLVGNMLAEGILPSLFHEDPRYFRMNEGKPSKRLLYAVSRIFVTRTDSGAKSFNFAEVFGNGIAAGVGLSYYSDSRSVGSYMQNWGTQLGTDALSQVLKEFWPDVKRWRARRKAEKQAGKDQL
jgi:hypothetical protein